MLRITKSNISEFQDFLINWYKKEGRQFPWREPGLSAYQIIIAETLLQRTKAKTIARFYENFINKFPDWRSLSQTDINIIEEFIKPLGLFRQRAKRLKNLANEMENRNWIVPRKRKDLESLPFIGQYIANSIELLIYGKRLPLLDVNMARLLERYFGKRNLSDIRYDPYLQRLALKIVNLEKCKEINWAILDYGALICKARNPLCSICKLRVKCLYFNQLND